MRDEIIQALQQMVQAIIDGTVVIGSMPPLGGYAVGYAGGAPMETFWPLNSYESMPVVFNGKGTDQQTVANAMNAVHYALTRSKALPFSDTWQVTAIKTTAAPQLVGREENINWVYGSSFKIEFYAR